MEPFIARSAVYFSLYNRDGVCLLCGTSWNFKCNSDYLEKLMRNKELKYKRCVIMLFWDGVYLFVSQHCSLIKSS
jgi:hypothetical protein